MKEGAGASHATITGLPHMSPTVEIVERFLLTQPTPIRYAVDHRYIYESPDDYAAKKLKCSSDTYRARLDIAANNLEAYLIEN
jgi:DNA-directed RNA polymerase specialized sigma24 family protein